VLTTLQLSVDLFLVKRYFPGGEEAGYYVAAQNIALVPYLGLSAFSQMILPSIAEVISTKKKDNARILISSALRQLTILLLPVSALFVATSSQLIKLIYSDRYQNGASSLGMLTIAYAALTIYMVCANSLNGAGKPRYSNAISASGLVLSIAGCMYLIPRYGLTGAASAITLSSIIVMLSGLISVVKVFDLRIDFVRVVKVLVLTAGVYIIASNAAQQEMLRLILGALAAISLYAVGLVITGEVAWQELKQINPSRVINRKDSSA
jgi:O-antigen/teichoic acid export membrane protein